MTRLLVAGIIGCGLLLPAFPQPLAKPEVKKAAVKAPAKVLQTRKVRKGESLAGIAKEMDVSLADLRKWNRLKTDQVKPGQVLRYFAPRLQPESVGRPGSGRLQAGVELPLDGPGYRMASDRTRRFGTPETIKYVKQCMKDYRRRFPLKKGPMISIGDLSSRGGGGAPPHVSHESGRDVDVGFITKPPQTPGVFDRESTSENLDREKQWVVVKCFLDNPATSMIFLQWPVVNALKDYIKGIYKGKRKALYQKYMRSFPGGEKPILRGDSDHRTHMHVRFHCPKGDRKCVE
jgi:murein endopeptidase